MSPLDPTRSLGNGSRRRRFSENNAKRLWYAAFRSHRFRRHYFGIPVPEIISLIGAAASAIARNQ